MSKPRWPLLKVIRIKEKQERKKRRYQKCLVKSITPAEKRLKSALEKAGVVFIFQKVVEGGLAFRIVDFWLPRGRRLPLVIEVDGGYHTTERQRRLDKKREVWLKEKAGCRILRFQNQDVMRRLSYVMDTINTFKPEVTSGKEQVQGLRQVLEQVSGVGKAGIQSLNGSNSGFGPLHAPQCATPGERTLGDYKAQYDSHDTVGS